MEAPQVRYARSGDVSIAYAVVGDGPFDLVFVSGWVLSVLESAWEGPAADTLNRLASFRIKQSQFLEVFRKFRRCTESQ